MEDKDLGIALDETEKLLRKVIILKTEAHYWALTLWIAFCYSISEFDYAPRLCFWSPEKRCGKSLALEVVGHLLPNTLATSSISSPALFRILDKDIEIAIVVEDTSVYQFVLGRLMAAAAAVLFDQL